VCILSHSTYNDKSTVCRWAAIVFHGQSCKTRSIGWCTTDPRDARTRLFQRAADQRLHAQPQHVRPVLLVCEVQQILRDTPTQRRVQSSGSKHYRKIGKPTREPHHADLTTE